MPTRSGWKKLIKTSKRNRWPIGGQRKVGMKGRRGLSIDRRQNKRLKRLETMIETKEGTMKVTANTSLAHNNVTLLQSSTNGGDWNPFYRSNGTGDPMSQQLQMIGDKMTVRGLSIRGMFENALGRSKVHFRILLLKGAKGDTFDRSTIFKGDANNKMIDQINTERFTIIAQKKFTISAANFAATGVNTVGGTPANAANVGGQGVRVFKMWVPGRKFGRRGTVTYENNSAGQVKFYDYRICIVAYDWYGTPQDINNVGIINEMYTKLYFKDA